MYKHSNNPLKTVLAILCLVQVNNKDITVEPVIVTFDKDFGLS